MFFLFLFAFKGEMVWLILLRLKSANCLFRGVWWHDLCSLLTPFLVTIAVPPLFVCQDFVPPLPCDFEDLGQPRCWWSSLCCIKEKHAPMKTNGILGPKMMGRMEFMYLRPQIWAIFRVSMLNFWGVFSSSNKKHDTHLLPDLFSHPIFRF